jgi:anaerobic magnesium-protoporphyrin IX monomethyl ester cyclase
MTTNARCDIVLAATPINWNQPRMDIRPPLNLIYLASYVKAKGLSCRVIDANNAEFNMDRMMREIETLQPRAVGVSFYQSTQEQGLKLCREVKARWPGIRTIGGGPLVTTSYADLLSGGELDVCVLGEGEETLLELLREDCPPLPDVAGIAYVDEHGQAIKSKPRPGIEDLDALPFLDYSVVDLDRYWVFQEQTNVPKSIFMTTSRGCAYKCTFCATPALWPGAVRRYSAQRVVDEIRYQRDVNGIVNISFLDDSFFANKPWLREYFRLVEPLGITYGCIGRADHLTEREVLALKKTGCRYVALGVESGVQDRQKTMKKLLNLDRVKETVRLLGLHGIFNKCFFMLGFPDETLEEMAETINFAVTLKTMGMVDCNIFAVNLFAGTELAEKYATDDMAAHIVRGSEIYSGSNAKLARYSTVPSIEVNPYVSRDRLLDMIVFAYDRIEAREHITAADLVQFTTGEVSAENQGEDCSCSATPRKHLAVLKPVLASSCSTNPELAEGC